MLDRRRMLHLALGAGAALGLGSRLASGASSRTLISRAIPSSGEKIPVVGLGSWITFNVGQDRAARDACVEVVRAFFDEGGRMIDSSPMYGSSQEVIGYGLRKAGLTARIFSADKVWTSSARGREPSPAQGSQRP